jgi:hypothetical protein
MNLKRKVIALSIVVLFAFAATIGATFAWFTIGQAAEVDEITLNVTSAESLLILMDDGYVLGTNDDVLLDPASYSSSLTNAMITPVYDFTQIRMMPLTSVTGLALTERDGLTAGNSVPTGNLLTTGNYIEFSVWIMSQSVDATVAIGEFQVAGTNTITYKDRVEDTIRMSVTDGTTTLIYGNDKDLDFQFQENQVGYSTAVEENVIDPLDEAAILLLYGEYYSATGLDVVNERNTDKALADTLTSLDADVPTKITIRIWIEGWDADADNNLNGAVFELNFQFIVKETA